MHPLEIYTHSPCNFLQETEHLRDPIEKLKDDLNLQQKNQRLFCNPTRIWPRLEFQSLVFFQNKTINSLWLSTFEVSFTRGLSIKTLSTCFLVYSSYFPQQTYIRKGLCFLECESELCKEVVVKGHPAGLMCQGIKDVITSGTVCRINKKWKLIYHCTPCNQCRKEKIKALITLCHILKLLRANLSTRLQWANCRWLRILFHSLYYYKNIV